MEKYRTMPYSAKNNKTNPLAPYSTLKPEISSLSPSLKSKGARFVSATHLIQKRGKTIKARLLQGQALLVFPFNAAKHKKKKIKEISYEMDCEQDRTLPMVLNLEVLLHPERRVV